MVLTPQRAGLPARASRIEAQANPELSRVQLKHGVKSEALYRRTAHCGLPLYLSYRIV